MQYRLTIEEICKKLRPVLGEKVDILYLKYKLSDNRESRAEIEQALHLLYQKYLNTSLLKEKVLLEPPSEEVISGDYPLATISYADKDICTFYLREKDWIRHICISGMSGSGKTTFAFQVIGNLILKNKPFLIFDWKKSFRPLMLVDENMMCFTIGNEKVSNFFKININKPPKGVSPKEWLNILCDLISESFFTSYGVHKLLSETLDRAFRDFGVYQGSDCYPTWFQIKERLEEMETSNRGRSARESEWLSSALRIAHVLTFGSFGETINYKGEGSMDIEWLLDKKVIFELNSLSNAEKKFFCEFILTYIYKLKKAGSDKEEDSFKHAIIVDEAHNIFLKDKTNFVKESVTDMVYRELREYGVSLICLDQHISKLSDVVAGNSACNIAFQQMLPQDIECVASIMQLRDRREYFSMLPVGQAIVKLAERYHKPFLIKAPYVELKKKGVEDEKVKQVMNKKVAFYRRVKKFREACELKNIKKKIERVDSIFKHSGVDTQDYSQIYIKPELAKKRVNLVNHLQRELSGKIAEMLENNDLRTIKEYFIALGYKNADINRAINHVLSSEHKDKPKLHSLTGLEREFLKIVNQNMSMPISRVYEKLGISVRKGNELKNKLLGMGLIRLNENRTGEGWTKQVELTTTGEQIRSF
jgi:hypothetical protein